MAMDGSFSLESAIKRFIARCPGLAGVDRLDHLVKKGHAVEEEEVVSSVAELFVNPDYTIPLIGCFRPFVRRIVDRAVELLGQCNLSSDVDDVVMEPGCYVDAGVVYVIEHYEQRRRGLIIHELACLAFCRALDLDPSLLGSVSAYFRFAPPPFERILRSRELYEVELTKAVTQYLLAVRISYRLLFMEPDFFSKFWDWSCFWDLVKKPVQKAFADIRWSGIQILSVTLKMSDRAIESFGFGAEEAVLCLLRWEVFCQDVAIEKVGSYIEPSECMELDSVNGGLDFSQQNYLKATSLNSLMSPQFHQMEPAVKSRRLKTWDDKSAGNVFVVTTTIKKSFDMVILAVSQKWPVLLYGPDGAGKSAIISKLARDSGNQVLSIHMDDQIDGKTLIGGYVCTEKPGEFRWQHGSLIQAVLNGYWVVFEDIDKAPSDVQSILLPLLEGANSFVTGHGEEIRVTENFRLFSTIATSKADISRSTEGGNILSTLWRKAMIGLPSNNDMADIVKAWYPSLDPIIGKLIETMAIVDSTSLQSVGRFSLRDLLKWCRRIAGLGFSTKGDVLTAYQCRCIYQEAVDIFASFSISAESRLSAMKEIAKVWGVPVSEARILHPYMPEIQDLLTELRIGRVTLQRTETTLRGQERLVKMRSSLHVLERIACSVKYNEPVLLVGETGTGKTTLVQNLASMLGQRLTVLNLSQQSDIADLLGGFKPMDPQSICIPLYKEFEALFSRTSSKKKNADFFAYTQKQLRDKNWINLLNGLKKCTSHMKVLTETSGSGKKRKIPLDAWEGFSMKLETALGQIGDSSGMVFSFVEGAFITALSNGEWILLDEVNLAPPETLQRVVGVLEGEYGSLCLAERGDVSLIPRHPSFRIFACMNPATDAGKRDLPHSLRSRFTEYFVDDVLDKEDLKLFINKFMEESRSNSDLEKKIIDFYEAAKKNSEERLQDGANQKPQYSLRSLYRALEYAREAKGTFGFQKAMYDGFSMFFLTLLDRLSAKIMRKMIKNKLLAGVKPSPVPFDAYLSVMKYSIPDDFSLNYVLTNSVKKQLANLARAVFIRRYPVLLQGPTSSGKTSLVQYLASITGHQFVRINNHEHTDLQEYLGSYISDAQGKLVFQEGVLVKAARNGYWIVLDELNLAPSDVLEALNRLLDDNRELFVPELRETIRAHPNFMLFATQNPPTIYGGRKMLSRAFRNRFVEVHVGEIPEHELSTIIEKRCKIPGSRAKIMVEIMKDLQVQRQSSKVFAGKHGFITPRDLFRWANRLRAFGDSKEVMAEQGFCLLADRLRDEGERLVVQEVLERHLRVKIVKDNLYKESVGMDLENFGDVIMTKSMRRLFHLVNRCYELREPVLLVGETGGGKTTVCQLLNIALGSKLHILNCHQYTETSDFIGGFYPIRDRSRLTSDFKYIVEKLMMSNPYVHFPRALDISSDISRASSTLDNLAVLISSYKEGQPSYHNVTARDLDSLEQMKLDLTQLHQKWQMIFMWQDGPLLQAMRDGDLFLVDEISLADDSVLERLNSVLEPERKLSLAEKGGSDVEEIIAHGNFFVLATMNPGGDYGKKELSPALRNRFTEVWVPSVTDLDELKDIASKRFSDPELLYIVDAMISFCEWFNELQTGKIITVRDLLSWVDFIKMTKGSFGADDALGAGYALFHGLFLTLLDGLSLGTGILRDGAQLLRERCMSFLLKEFKLHDVGKHELSILENYGWGDLGTTADISFKDDMQCDQKFGIHPFYIKKGADKCEPGGFEFLAPTTRRNALRVLRAMQLSKPVLLEGSPGVGKTSLITALGKYSGHKVVRINLSEQTDLMDLLGSDLPVEGADGMKFAWCDGILLQALKEGCWVLLDELNLAPQSVLEGLNAILDHRAQVFIPELGLTFKCPSSFRVFACQNPFTQGGGRKGLPRSFLNRFTKVYIDELVEDDYLFICGSLYPSMPRPLLSKLILFNKRLHEDTMLHRKYGQDGSPWEFNLRDVIRSCQLIQGAPGVLKVDRFLNVLYVQRMRTASDRKEVLKLYEEVFGVKPFINPYPRVQVNPQSLIVGNTVVRRNAFHSSKLSDSQLSIIPSIRNSLEAVVNCVQNQWLCILVGPASSGKTSLIRLLAQLTGNKLNELNLSSATDISELLGCFEQYNAFRNFRFVLSQVERYVSEYCSLQLQRSDGAFMSEKKDFVAKWFALSSSMDSNVIASTASISSDKWECIVNSLSLLAEIIEQLKLDVATNGLPVSWSSKELNKTIKMISKLQEEKERRSVSAKFEWVTGLLVKAIENGEWVIMENANLCNPTVLDRINSLVEPSGSITVNECGIVDGSPVILHPHPNFRLLLTVNPSYGEVSRAMRNRGVEIFMMQPYWLLCEDSRNSCEEYELKDVKRFLILSGIPVGELVDAMAKAHLYARSEGLSHNVHITYLELARWVQLFQQLLINGNQPSWSLHISWEHIYLFSLGEDESQDIINHAKNSYLSKVALFGSDFHVESSLYLPGGWPRPLATHDNVWYSKETSIKQNSMYLEYLVAQYDLGLSGNRECIDHASSSITNKGACIMDIRTVHRIIFPNASRFISNSNRNTEFDLGTCKRMLLFAADWVIEQATENDYKLYLLRFRWFNSKLKCRDHFFKSFLDLLEQEFEHPIWSCIFRCHRDLSSLHKVDLSSDPIPLLSLDFVNSAASEDLTRESLAQRITCSENLHNAINCVSLLRRSYQLWNAQSEYCYDDAFRCFKPVLESLRELEDEVLNTLVASPSCHMLITLYADVLDDHTAFWNAFSSSQHDKLLTSWRFLLKNVLKFRDSCPRSLDHLSAMVTSNLDEVFYRQSHQSLLWVRGGHPTLPTSAELYNKQQLLLELCESVWPRKADPYKKMSDFPVEVVASCNPELRNVVVQGICMSSVMNIEDDNQVVLKLEEMCQMLLDRFEHEKRRLEAKLLNVQDAVFEESSVSCCVYCPEILCTKFDSLCWHETLPIVDSSSIYLDMELLKKLAVVVTLDPIDLQLELGRLSDLLESALKYSLSFSTRPPQNFVPHQKLLWTLDAWTSVDAVNEKFTNYVLEIWFSWHSSVWSCHPVSVENFSQTASVFQILYDRFLLPDVLLPDVLIQPLGTASVFQILNNTLPIKDYLLKLAKLKVASSNFWGSSPAGKDLSSFLLPVARSLFQQIIHAHQKLYDADKFIVIKSIFCSFQKDKIKKDDIQQLCSLVASSNHKELNSLLHMFVEPMLGKLYHHCSSTDVYLNAGYAWLWIGRLRFSLLLNGGDVDPTMKYSCKYSQLEEKKSLLELETKMRQECNYLAGVYCSREADKKREDDLERINIECKRIRRKMVFRCNSVKFNALRKECEDFLKHIKIVVDLVSKIEAVKQQQVLDEVLNWQTTATCFIDRLSDEYKEYIDLAQPVQVAVYEMKLGLSLLLSVTLLRRFLDRIEEDDVDKVMESIYSFMRFPRPNAVELVSSNDVDIPTNFWEPDLGCLEKLVSISQDVTGKEVSVLQHRSALHQNILFRIACFVSDARRIDNASLKILDKMFHEFAGMWMNMKVEVKNKEGFDAQQYKFRPRALSINSVVDVDISALGKLFANDSFLEWQELISEEENLQKTEESEGKGSLEDEWNLMKDTVLINVIHIHSQLFGSTNLVVPPGIFHISEADRLHLFANSYTMGAEIIKGLGGLCSSSLDSKLVPEHLLRLSLEHDWKFVSPHKSSAKYNFYKDANAPVMAKMVKLLMSVRKQILGLLSEWEDNLGLQKLIDAIDMLLGIPMDTPLAKALSGLQYLLNKARVLQENGSRFSLSGHLEPIVVLVSSWQKMEYESWPALLEEVEVQCDNNAEKLWFPLFSVLHYGQPADIDKHVESTIESLRDFMKTSSIGEYKGRLQLLLAFHGHISAVICLELEPCLSVWHKRNQQILYNVFGYYMQLLPRILAKIEANRKKIEVEVKELLKLCRWERTEVCLSIESSKRTRQKLKKLIRKYTDFLEQPVMPVLEQELELKGVKQYQMQDQGWLNFSEKKAGASDAVLDLTESIDRDRSLWFIDWRKKVHDALQHLQLSKTSSLSFLDIEDVTGIMQLCTSSHAVWLQQQKEWNAVSQTLEKIHRSTMDCDDLWSDASKGVGKKRALSDLLKLLESSGLQKHKIEIENAKGQMSNNSNWFDKPSYDTQHLLLTQSRVSCGTSVVTMDSGSGSQSFPGESLVSEWKMANEFYFKSMASVQLLQTKYSKPHEDINFDQVSRSVSFLKDLITIQQKQRDAAYGFAKYLNRLRECLCVLQNLYSKHTGTDAKTASECSIVQNQRSILKCMWKQKHLLDGLSALLIEESLLLRTVANAHLEPCPSVRPAATHVLEFLDKFIPVILKSKESLDDHLLGQSGDMHTLFQESIDKTLMQRAGTGRDGPLRPYAISKQMTQLASENFEVIMEFQDELLTFRKQETNRSSVIEELLGRFDDVFRKAKSLAVQFDTALQARNKLTILSEENERKGSLNELEAEFDRVVVKTLEHVVDVFRKEFSSSVGHTHPEESLGKITSWEYLFKSCEEMLSVENLYDNLLKTIFGVEKLLDHSGSETSRVSLHVGACFEHLHSLLSLVLSFGAGFLQDLLAMHKTVCVMTHMLANVLASLFSKGFCIPSKDEVDDTDNGLSEDASGTGMGEGHGVKDVSNQITDEDQLLGNSEKADEEQDTSGELPNKNDKGIEMEQDFTGDTFSVSEDSGDENDDVEDEDDKLESAMGETGDDGEAINEKLCDKEDNENPENSKEKYESGPSVRDKDSSSRELRAKDESAADANDESGEYDKEDDEVENKGDLGDGEENMDDLSMDKDEAFADPTGLKLDESNEGANEDMDVDEDVNEKADSDLMEGGQEEVDEPAENATGEEDNVNAADENVEEAEMQQMDGDLETNDQGRDSEENAEMNSMKPREDTFGPEISDLMMPGADSATQPSITTEGTNTRNGAPEANISNTSDAHADVAPMRNLPSGDTSGTNIMISDSSNNARFTEDQQTTQVPQSESARVQNTKLNPYRNVGSALEEWKERVKVTVDLEANKAEALGEMEDENAAEYGYVLEFEKGTAQALGPATSEQMVSNPTDDKLDEDTTAGQREATVEMEIENQSSDELHVKPYASVNKNKMDEKRQISDSEELAKNRSLYVHDYDRNPGSLSESLVSAKKSLLSEDIYQLSKLSVDDNDLGKVHDPEDVSQEVRGHAYDLWRRYELRTTRLSHELAEQLRLVLEPTLANKLQGDYKTGKRINMKKVIAYIASYFRKDKIWLRRTLPNKRDYQVVIAVDDSRSMSESRCGDFAVEALVTVCRAMSQLEMGNLAVASYGQTGNIKLLHDFDRPFSAETGVKIISNLTFEQENTIADNPVVDLLKCMNNMLDTAVAKARLPSGQNPLQQLVLIIADGRFHEKEKLKRCVRDFLSRKRMVAFLVLDSPNPDESIMDHMEATFVGEGDKRTVKFTKYLDSFPFPYYIVLRNIQALPRTLGDLLRQWFELMQSSRD